MTEYRSDLPLRPRRMRNLLIDKRGFPVPWFVHIDEKGEPDFRVIRQHGIAHAHNKELCWLCGERRGVYMTFVIGPMCGINRTTSEPPCHTECAEYAVKACPFLTRPMATRNERGIEDGYAAGMMIKRNPGVTLLWTTKSYKPFRVGAGNGSNAGVLFKIGEPTNLEFYREGRVATLAEIEESVASGLPNLEKMAQLDGPDAEKELRSWQRVFNNLIARFVPIEA